MSADENPIISLQQEISDRKLSVEKAMETASSDKFLDKLNENHFEEVFSAIAGKSSAYATEMLSFMLFIAEKKQLKGELLTELKLNYGINLIRHGDVERGISVLDEIKLGYQKFGREREEGACHLYIGVGLKNHQENEKAILSLQAARDIFTKVGENTLLADCNTEMAEICETTKNYEKATSLYLSAMKEYNRRDSHASKARCELGIGRIYKYLGQFDQALKYCQSSLIAYEALHSVNNVAICKYHVGEIFANTGQYDKALVYLEPARELFEKEQKVLELAGCDFIMGGVYNFLRNYDKALWHYQSAKELFDKYARRVTVGECSYKIGLIYTKLGQNEDALLYLQSARKIFENNSEKIDCAMCDLALGMIHNRKGLYEEAVIYFHSAMRIFEKVPQNRNVAMCEFGMGDAHNGLSRYDEALRHYESARGIFEKDHAEEDVAGADLRIGNMYVRFGQFDDALRSYRSAREVFEKNQNDIEVARCNCNIAIVEIILGWYDKAFWHIRTAKEIFVNKHSEVDIAECDFDYAYLHSSLGHYHEAIQHYQSAKAIFEKNRNEKGVAQCNQNIGIVYCHWGQYDEAIRHYQSAREIFEKKHMEDEIAGCDFAEASAYMDLDQYDEAIRHYQSARGIFQKKHMEVDVARCDLCIAKVCSSLDQYHKAISLFSRLKETFSYIPELKWKVLEGQADVYSKMGETEKTGILYREAIEVIEGMHKEASQEWVRTSILNSGSRVYFSMVDYCFERKDFRGALEYVERLKSRNLAETISHRTLIPRNATIEEQREYERTQFQLDMLSHRLSKEQDRQKGLALMSEMEELEQIHYKRIENFRKRDPSFDPDQREKISYEDIKRLVIDSKTALIELFPMLKKTVAFIVKPDEGDGFRTVEIEEYNLSTLKVHIDRLMGLYFGVRGTLQHEDKMIEWKKYLDEVLVELYQKIFLKIKDHLSGIKKIILIPYGGFHLLPFHAMFIRENGKRHYVIDRYLVTYAPSAKILRLCREREKRQDNSVNGIYPSRISNVAKDSQEEKSNSDRIIIAIANPKKSKNPENAEKPENREERTYLFFANYEAKVISGLFKDKNTKLIQEATRRDIIQYGKNAEIFHYIGHAYPRALLLHDEEDKKKVEEYSLNDISVSLDLSDCYLAVLSSCETGMIAQLGMVDEYVGLTSGFLRAGATTVVSSLWSAHDLSTTLLMGKMYQLLKGGKEKAEALCEAQRWLKNSEKRKEHLRMLSEFKLFNEGDINIESLLPSDLSDPYYWAGFICSGVDGSAY